jgi:hypothetical protein
VPFLVGGGLIVAAISISGRHDSLATAATRPQRPSVTPGSSHRKVNFRDRLVVGLEARRPSEIEFIDEVAARVRLGQIPERLVNQTFFWSRDRVNRIGRDQRPIIYFQPVMTAQARRLGVRL